MPTSKKRIKKRRRGETGEHKQFQGSMSSMRSGFQKLAGTKEKRKKQDSGFRFIAVLILIAVAILLVWGIAR